MGVSCVYLCWGVCLYVYVVVPSSESSSKLTDLLKNLCAFRKRSGYILHQCDRRNFSFIEHYTSFITYWQFVKMFGLWAKLQKRLWYTSSSILLCNSYVSLKLLSLISIFSRIFDKFNCLIVEKYWKCFPLLLFTLINSEYVRVYLFL